MSLGRREFIVAALAGTACVTATASGLPLSGASRGNGLLIVDSRLPGSAAVLSAASANFSEIVDIAGLGERYWSALTSLSLRDVDYVSACTGWQDFVVLRDVFRQRRLHLAYPERRLDVAGGRSLFLWRMV